MGTTTDRLLRLMVVVAEGTPYPLNSLRAVALDGPKLFRSMFARTATGGKRKPYEPSALTADGVRERDVVIAEIRQNPIR